MTREIQIGDYCFPRWLAHLVIVIVIAALVLGAAIFSPAHADFMLTTPNGGSYIFRNNIAGAEPHVIHVPRDLSAEAQERERAWDQACVLGFRTDNFGVEHYVYRRAGCEYGRIDGRLK